ncbi:competence protein ComEA [Krasilnikovia cinnamomea]|uniref:Competence protein ComEA n=1 Tax=Krasilnikovia cinnamomea TaxID=349313 RepID=A0A4Q7ZQ68_9ACTN|nr:competence protein ComEA [Krasilnikovia cinnamomea]
MDRIPAGIDSRAAEAARQAGQGAFGPDPQGIRGSAALAAFDPGRRGVRALAAVAAVVVLVAGVLAWRARPRVEPVPAAVGVPAVAPAGSPGAGSGPADGVPAPAVASAARSAGVDIVVAVGGKVRKPGLVHLPPGARVADALQAAGGADPGVDVALLNLARKVVDGELIMVGVAAPPAAPAAPTGPAGAAAPAGPVNLNTATLADLDSLPGVGPVLAQRILDARQARGGFATVSDLRQVDGIGEARYEQLKDLVTV